MKQNPSDYIENVRRQMAERNYSDEKINEVVEKLQSVDLDKLVLFKGYKYIKNRFLGDIATENIFYYTVNDWCTAVCIKIDEVTYDVAFTFVSPKELYFDPDYKKYALCNYLKSKYCYKGVHATAPINAVCLAFNKNKNEFPSFFRDNKIVPKLYIMKEWYSYNPPIYDGDVDDIPEYLKHPGLKYNALKQQLWDNGISALDVRYYMEFPTVNAMVIKNSDNTFTVTFSFLNKKDRKAIQQYCANSGECVNSCKVACLTNYFDKKYTYVSTDTRNSISSVARQYNLHKEEFPTPYAKTRMRLSIASQNTNTCLADQIYDIKVK